MNFVCFGTGEEGQCHMSWSICAIWGKILRKLLCLTIFGFFFLSKIVVGQFLPEAHPTCNYIFCFVLSFPCWHFFHLCFPRVQKVSASLLILTSWHCTALIVLSMSRTRVDIPKRSTFHKENSIWMHTHTHTLQMFAASEQCECSIANTLGLTCYSSGAWCLLLTEASHQLSVNSLVNPEDLFVASDIA